MIGIRIRKGLILARSSLHRDFSRSREMISIFSFLIKKTEVGESDIKSREIGIISITSSTRESKKEEQEHMYIKIEKRTIIRGNEIFNVKREIVCNE